MAELIHKVSQNLARISAAAPKPLGDQQYARTSMHHEDFVKHASMEKGSLSGTDDVIDDGVPRSGNTFTAVGHTITAVIGAGVLSLPYAISMLGWVAGPLCLGLFASITLYTSQLLADCGVINGLRQRTYTNVVETTFGRWGYLTIGWVQHSNLVLTALAYQITGGLSLQTVAKSICAAQGATDCFDSYWKWAIIFAAIQVLMVQMPDLSYFWWASLIGAAMSFSYSTIALALSIREGNTHGTVGGQSLTPSEKGFGILNSVGAILFAYSFSMILIEIQDTLKGAGKGGPVRVMQKAVQISVAAMTSFYMAVSVAGYMAFGNAVPGNILNAFDQPRWVIDMANIMVVIHMIPAYQVYSQPFLAFSEYHYNQWRYAPSFFKGITFRLVYRTAYVILIGFLGICLPFFGDIVGLVGAIGFWPATVFFPIECWIRVYRPNATKRMWLRCLNVGCFIVTLAATVGSVQLIVVDSQSYEIFSD
ncbi:hypothetical protein ACKKBF_B37390 [Auxenochlorella protothecoides x Auxenochlorella symbiontica]|uniref:Amino acid transporter transmembrane domain-containing protein n=3 Tax=Auxenochlorella protothecoides TaxID=3075 RepID=A0A1D2ADT7_AUXPR